MDLHASRVSGVKLAVLQSCTRDTHSISTEFNAVLSLALATPLTAPFRNSKASWRHSVTIALLAVDVRFLKRPANRLRRCFRVPHRRLLDSDHDNLLRLQPRLQAPRHEESLRYLRHGTRDLLLQQRRRRFAS